MNTQVPLKPVHLPNGHLSIHSIFPTIQGEGIFAGHPATFVRLAGCNLRCPACDTEYTALTDALTAPFKVLKHVEAATAPNRLIVITGGEPFRQNLAPLVDLLVAAGYTVQIETNGTLAPTFNTQHITDGQVFIMCSPKTDRLHVDLIDHISAYKYVVSYLHVNVTNGLPTKVLDLKVRGIAYPPATNIKPVFVQPMDSKDADVNDKHLQATMRSALTHGYTLCLQIHKIINVE